jgi:cob(I)alamin adenosyltransferase
MVRKSALSAVQEDAKKLSKSLGAEDRARLDQYFTGIRDLERRFDLQLSKPEPREACIVPGRAERPARRDSTRTWSRSATAS